MVLIEANPQTIETREEVSPEVAKQLGIQFETGPEPKVVLKKTIKIKNPEFFSKAKETIAKIFAETKGIFGDLFSGGLKTMGHSAYERAQHHIKECWNHMASNEVEQAKKDYEKLRDVYETMTEGQEKTEVYYEVFDIYSRLSEVKA